CNTPAMDITLRPITSDEWPAFKRATGIAFGGIGDDDEEGDFWAAGVQAERTIAAFDGDAIVGTAAAFSFELTVPGGALVPWAGRRPGAARGRDDVRGPPQPPPARAPRRDDGGAARRRRRARRAARGADRVGVGDLRAIRVRARDLRDVLAAPDRRHRARGR